MRRLLLLPVLALALSACAADPEATLRGDVEDVIAAANSNDAAAMTSAVDDLIGTISEQRAQGDLGQARAAELRELALAVKAAAGALDAEPSPSPEPSPSESPSPSPSPSPEPSPSEEPSPSPSPEEPSPEPEPSDDEPDESDDPIIDNPLSPSPAAVQASPAAQSSAAAQPSPAAQTDPTPAAS